MSEEYIDLDDDGMPLGDWYGSSRKKKQKKQDRKGENELDWKLLDQFHLGKFPGQREKVRWHKITKKALDTTDPEATLYRIWIEEIMAWGVGKSMYAVFTACENEERWTMYRDRNKDKVVDPEQQKQIEETLDALETVIRDE